MGDLRDNKLHKPETAPFSSHPIGIYLREFNNRNTRSMCEICSKLTAKTAERRGIVLVSLLLTLNIVSLLLTLNMLLPAGQAS